MNLEYELEKRLVNWSHYVLEKSGYPNKSTIADFGLPSTGVRQSKPPFPLSNLQADEMNGWINVMGIEHPEYKNAILAYYLRRDGRRIWEIAKDFQVSLRTFKQRLHDARIWLTGRLSTELPKENATNILRVQHQHG